MFKNCPMGPDEGFKGVVWTAFNKHIRGVADEWLKLQASYSPPKPAAKIAARHRGYTTATQQAGAAHGTQQQWSSIPNYENNDTTSDMHYPTTLPLSSTALVGDGKTWQLPQSMKDQKRVRYQESTVRRPRQFL